MKHPGNCPGKVSYAEFQGYKIKVQEYDISYGATITSPSGENFYITHSFHYTLKRYAFQILKKIIRKSILEDILDNQNNNLLTSAK